MQSVNKSLILGFVIIILIGVGLLIGGIVHLDSKKNLIETEGYVVSIYTRIGDDGFKEYKPSALRYFVDGVAYETSSVRWFKQPIQMGDTMTVWYKKDNPRETVISNVSNETMSLALMGFGGVLIVAGIALICKYLYDVKRRKKV